MIIGKIQDGIVLDHIKPGYGMKLYEILGLDKLDCQVAYIKNADSEKYGKMGMQIGLSVRLQPNSYKDKDGNTRYTMDLVVEDIWFDNAPSKEKEASSSSVEAAPATPVAEAKADVSEVSDEDIENLPFY